MPSKNDEISARLRQFMNERFTTVGLFATALGMGQPSVSSYLNGSRTPGNKMQERLRELGCNIDWLMTGKTTTENKVPDDTIIRFYAKEPPSPEQLARMQRIVQMMVDNPDANNELLEKLAKDILHDGK
jgi:transcriptional regulator with XRE-family HTH domain